MKCPKCGYNSFELYDSCRKCSSDLAGFKQTHGIRAIVHPPQFLWEDALPAGAFTAEAPLVADDMVETAAPAENIAWDLPSDDKQEGEDGFAGFDLDFSMDDEKENEFSFDEEPAAEAKEEELGFGEFSFDEEESASADKELDDLLASADDGLPEEADSDTPGEFDFDTGEEFSLESNAISFDLKEDGSLPAFNMDALDMDAFGGETAAPEEQPKKESAAIDIADLNDDWPSFFEEEKAPEDSKK